MISLKTDTCMKRKEDANKEQQDVQVQIKSSQ